MSFAEDAGRLERLAVDLRILDANGGNPTIEQLTSAPILTEWRTFWALDRRLVGKVVGHPLNGPGLISTSSVWAEGAGWARTLSRFYQLTDKANL